MEYPPSLSESYNQALKRGKVNDVMDLFTKSCSELSKRCRLPPSDIKTIIDVYCKHLAATPRSLKDVIEHDADQKFTTGDEILDRALGGGIRTGMVWEFVGESASGKSQLALQLSLLVQLPPKLGGISGSTCYVTTQTELETRRLMALREAHPLLSSSVCTLDDIQTVKTATIPLLQKVLKEMLPQLIKSKTQDSSKKQVRLVVIDSIADLFPSVEKTTSTTLAERSRSLAEISVVLHDIARTFQIAVVVLNKVGDVFNWRSDGMDPGDPGDLIYRDQSQWFNRADTMHEERQKEALLGLVWANQVNVRIMFTRTSRRRFMDEIEGRASKRRRVDESLSQHNEASSLVQDTTLLRRLTVIFSSVSVPSSVDFILTEEGISAPSELQTAALPPVAGLPYCSTLPKPPGLIEVASLDIGSAEIVLDPPPETEAKDDNTEWDSWWNEGDELYENLNLSVP